MADIVLTGDTSGAITVAAPAVAGTNTLTLPATTGNIVTTGDSSTITQGMIASNVAGTGPVFRAYSTVTQTGVAASTQTKVLFPTEEFDIGGNFASSRFTAPIDGYYHFSASVHIVGAQGLPQTTLYVNGAIKVYGNIQQVSTNDNVSPTLSATVYLNAGDYAEVYTYSTNASSFFGNASLTWFSGFLVRGA